VRRAPSMPTALRTWRAGRLLWQKKSPPPPVPAACGIGARIWGATARRDRHRDHLMVPVRGGPRGARRRAATRRPEAGGSAGPRPPAAAARARERREQRPTGGPPTAQAALMSPSPPRRGRRWAAAAAAPSRWPHGRTAVWRAGPPHGGCRGNATWGARWRWGRLSPALLPRPPPSPLPPFAWPPSVADPCVVHLPV